MYLAIQREGVIPGTIRRIFTDISGTIVIPRGNDAGKPFYGIQNYFGELHKYFGHVALVERYGKVIEQIGDIDHCLSNIGLGEIIPTNHRFNSKAITPENFSGYLMAAEATGFEMSEVCVFNDFWPNAVAALKAGAGYCVITRQQEPKQLQALNQALAMLKKKQGLHEVQSKLLIVKNVVNVRF